MHMAAGRLGCKRPMTDTRWTNSRPGCIYITFSIWGAMSLAKVENVAALQLFTLGGSGGMPPQEILTILGACSEVLLVH